MSLKIKKDFVLFSIHLTLNSMQKEKTGSLINR